MRTVKLEHLRPGEILKEKQVRSLVYLSIGPLEWHGPGMPYGTDPLVAEYIAQESAKQTGGVVMPTLYIGTERERKPEMLEAMGFEDTSQYIVGQDFPSNSMKSFYFKEDVFCMILRAFLDLLVKQGFETIVILNGHGADNQTAAAERICTEYTNETGTRVVYLTAVFFPDGLTEEIGHGTCMECSEAMYLSAEDVDLREYPEAGVKLKSNEWGINDIYTFMLKPNEDHTVRGDPRQATAEKGERYLAYAVSETVRAVEALYKEK